MSTSTEEPSESKEIQGDDEFKILEADEKAEEAEIEDKQKQEVEVPVEPTDEIIDNRVPIVGKHELVLTIKSENYFFEFV